MKNRKLLMMFMLIPGLLYGCAGSLIPKSPPLQYYQPEYVYRRVEVPCGDFKDKILRVWDFNAKPPFDGTEMVVKSDGPEVAVSKSYQWIDSPGSLVAEWIRKDIDRDGMFGGAYETLEVNREIDFELGGTVEHWSLVKTDKGYIASIEITVTVWCKKPKPFIIFKKHYSMKSSNSITRDPETFARALSELIKELSYEFRLEFYKSLTERFSSTPNGGPQTEQRRTEL